MKKTRIVNALRDREIIYQKAGKEVYRTKIAQVEEKSYHNAIVLWFDDAENAQALNKLQAGELAEFGKVNINNGQIKII